MAGYSSRSLRDKLGVKDGMHTLLIEVPKTILDEINLKEEPSTPLTTATYDFIHAFFLHREDLEKNIGKLKDRLDFAGMLWISWRKKSADPDGELDENIVREIGLGAGLVDVKVCAVNETWSGLKFVFRKEDRPKKK
jgi:hypothetical protein